MFGDFIRNFFGCQFFWWSFYVKFDNDLSTVIASSAKSHLRGPRHCLERLLCNLISTELRSVNWPWYKRGKRFKRFFFFLRFNQLFDKRLNLFTVANTPNKTQGHPTVRFR